jgi:flagellin
MSFNASKGLEANQILKKESLEKSSKTTTNRAGENKKLTLPEDFRKRIKELQEPSNNAQNAISLIQTAESALEETRKKLINAREFVVNASNEANVSADNTAIQKEIVKLSKDINRIAANTEFNSKKLLTGKETIEFFTGSNNSTRISIPISDMSSYALGKNVVPTKSLDDVNVTDFESVSANQQLRIIDKSIKDVSSEMDKLGGIKEKFQDTIKDMQSENDINKNSFIEGSTEAQDMLESYKKNVLLHPSNTMKAQSNQSPLAVLQLLE